MTEQEILKHLETILYNAKYTSEVQDFGFYGLDVISMEESYYVFRNNTIDLLRALHHKLPTNKEKDFLLGSLMPRTAVLSLLPNQPKVYQLARAKQDFIFIFLIKIKGLEKAFRMLTNYVTVSSSNNELLEALLEVLIAEPNIFDDNDLEKILSIIDTFSSFVGGLKYYIKKTRTIAPDVVLPLFDPKKIEEYKVAQTHYLPECESVLKKIKDRIYEIRQERLSASLLEGINFEVNQDEKQLQAIMADFGFNKKLNEIITKINEKLYDAKDPFDFKNCIDLIRALLNELCISIALEIQDKKKITPSLPINSMGRAEQYFRDARVNFLTQDEIDFVIQYNKFISHSGVHALQSEKEYARISRNLVIELGLFLIEKLKKYLSIP